MSEKLVKRVRFDNDTMTDRRPPVHRRLDKRVVSVGTEHRRAAYEPQLKASYHDAHRTSNWPSNSIVTKVCCQGSIMRGPTAISTTTTVHEPRRLHVKKTPVYPEADVKHEIDRLRRQTEAQLEQRLRDEMQSHIDERNRIEEEARDARNRKYMPLVSHTPQHSTAVCDAKILTKIANMAIQRPSSLAIDDDNKLRFTDVMHYSNRACARTVNRPKTSISKQIATLASNDANSMAATRLDAAGDLRNAETPNSRVDSMIRDSPFSGSRHSAILSSTRRLVDQGHNKYYHGQSRGNSAWPQPASGIPPVQQAVWGDTQDEKRYFMRDQYYQQTSFSSIKQMPRMATPLASFTEQKNGLPSFRQDSVIFKTEPVMPSPDNNIYGYLINDSVKKFADNKADNMSSYHILADSSVIQEKVNNGPSMNESINDQQVKSPIVPLPRTAFKDSRLIKTPGGMTTAASTRLETSTPGSLTARLDAVQHQASYIYTEENLELSKPGIDDGDRLEHARHRDGSVVLDESSSHGDLHRSVLHRPVNLSGRGQWKQDIGTRPESYVKNRPSKQQRKTNQVTFEGRKDSIVSQTSKRSHQSSTSSHGWRIDKISQKLDSHKRMTDQVSHGLMMTSTGNLYSMFFEK